jgi:DNA-binding NarL/FixJ family response regulator
MHGQLTTREIEILKLLSEGKTMPEIAEIINRSGRTIAVHRANIGLKLDVHNCAQAVMVGLERGWLRLRERYE